MTYLNRIFEPHLGRLQEGLGKASQRHALLVGNLANLNTPGYKRRDMDFSVELDRAKVRLLGPTALTQRSTQGSQRFDQNSVDLEREIVGLTETETRYATLTDMTARFFRGLRDAIAEGRR